MPIYDRAPSTDTLGNRADILTDIGWNVTTGRDNIVRGCGYSTMRAHTADGPFEQVWTRQILGWRVTFEPQT